MKKQAALAAKMAAVLVFTAAAIEGKEYLVVQAPVDLTAAAME